MEAHEILLNYPQQRWYLKERKIDEAVESLWLGWWDGWYTFPIKTEDGNIVGVMIRASPSIEQYYPTRKYVALPLGIKPQLYVPEWHIVNKSPRVFVPFGVIDAVTLNLCRIPAATPIYGQTSKPAVFAQMRKSLHIIPDKGEEETARMLACHLDFRGHLERLDYQSDEKDPNDIYQHNPKRLQTALAY